MSEKVPPEGIQNWIPDKVMSLNASNGGPCWQRAHGQA